MYIYSHLGVTFQFVTDTCSQTKSDTSAWKFPNTFIEFELRKDDYYTVNSRYLEFQGIVEISSTYKAFKLKEMRISCRIPSTHDN